MADIVGRELEHSSTLTPSDMKAAAFIWLLILVTVIFYLLAPLAATSWWPTTGIGAFYGMLIYLNTIHVALTPFVYFDRSSYRVISKYRLRFFIGVPAIYAIFFLIFLYLPPRFIVFFFIWFGLWSFWHFQKQHYGVFCFMNSYYSSRATQAERWVTLAATLPVMIAIIPVTMHDRATPTANFLAPYSETLMLLALLTFLVVAVAGVALAIKRFRASAEQPILARIVMAASLLFFSTNYWPILLIKPFSLAATMTTGGHGLQYCVFMAVYAYARPTDKTKPQPRWHAVTRGIGALAFMFLIGMGMWAILVGWLPTQTSIVGLYGATLPAALASVGIAITGTHYLLDAVLWRLSEPNARFLVRQKYDFVFGRAL